MRPVYYSVVFSFYIHAGSTMQVDGYSLDAQKEKLKR